MLVKLEEDRKFQNTLKVLSVEGLVSEIGGTLGLFLGFSFLTLWDAVEFLGGLLGKLSLNLFK